MDVDRWPKSSALWSRSKRVLAGGVSTGLRAGVKPHPLFFDRAKGARMWDVDGHELLDYVLGWGPVILGHCDQKVTKAVQEQAARGETFGAQHDLEYMVAEKILSHYPFAERLLFSNTGSEAVQVAVRLARAWTGRSRILKFVGHYHGWSDALFVSYRPPATSVEPHLESKGQNPKAAEDVIVARWNDRQSVESAMEQYGSDIAAVIAEPVLCNSGVIAPEPGFLQFLRDVTRTAGTALIFDEVITGYRVGLTGATGRFGVDPDLVVLGKAVANGYPLSVVAGRATIIDLAAHGGVVHAGTFNGNPIVLSAAWQTLTALEAPGTFESLEERSQELASGLRSAFEAHSILSVINQVGGIVQVLPLAERARDYQGYAESDWDFYNALTVELLKQNIFVMPGGRLYLSTSHTADDVQATIRAVAVSLTAIAG